MRGSIAPQLRNRHREEMNMYLRFALTVMLLPAFLAAQSPKSNPVSVPPIEDPELYYSFFYHHQDLINTNQAAKAANPPNSAQLDQQMATLLGVDVKELGIVIGNTQQVVQSHAALAADRRAYKPAAAPQSGQPTAKQMNAEFELKRVRITVEGVRLLAQNLSPASWTGLHAYIVGSYKNTIYSKH
jgi:hypothetical protein